MPASTLLLIAIGVLSVCAMVVHFLVRQTIVHERPPHRVRNGSPHDAIVADWLKPSHERDLTSASA